MGTTIQKQDLSVVLESHFEVFEKQAKEWQEKANQIKVTDITQVDEMKQARTARLELRRIRIDVTAKHKELKEDYLNTTQLLDGVKRRLVGLIEPIEEYLQQQEDFAELQEAKRKKELLLSRIALLEPYVGEQARYMRLEELDEQVFETILSGQKAAKEQKDKLALEEAARKAEADRIEVERQEAIKLENERLKKESEERQAELDKERAERQRLEDEQRLKAQQEEDERKAKLAAERKLKRAPDAVKLKNFAEQIQALVCPNLKDDEAEKIRINAQALLNKVVVYINTNADKL